MWCQDEQRLGLKQKIRRVWTPVGEQPIASVKTQYQWLWVYGFVHPESGETYFAIAYLIVESGNLFPDRCIYINHANIRLGRVTNFANSSKDMVPNSRQTPLCCEYWCDFGDSTWQQSEAERLLQTEQDLRTVGLLPEAKVAGGFVVKLARTHPIYAVNYQEALSEVNDYLNQFENLDIIGRYGAFQYHDQDGSLYMGILAAENAVSKSGVS